MNHLSRLAPTLGHRLAVQVALVVDVVVDVVHAQFDGLLEHGDAVLDASCRRARRG